MEKPSHEKTDELLALCELFEDGIVDKYGAPLDLATLIESSEMVGVYLADISERGTRNSEQQILEFYETQKQEGKAFEIIYLSCCDHEDVDANTYRDMPWPRVPYNPDVTSAFMRKFWTFTAPRMVLFSPDGSVFSKEGVSLIRGFPHLYPWPDRCNLNRWAFKWGTRLLGSLLLFGLLYGLLMAAV
eukprot:m.289287 g.289287  ORF g.289287 m.289287 type:complete len:187 (-) comp17796_c0_seq1:11536-12096(-)